MKRKKRLSRDEAPGALVRQFGGSAAIIFAMTADSQHGVTIRKVTETGFATSVDVAEVLCNHLGCSHMKRLPEEYYERQRLYADDEW